MPTQRSVTISGVLSDNAVPANPVPNQGIDVKDDKGTDYGVVTTATDGSYTKTVNVAAPGTYIFTGTFAGGAGYDPSSKSTGSTQVNVKTAMTITAVVN